MELGGFFIGTVAGITSGAWAYWRLRLKGSESAPNEGPAAVAAGLVTTVVASLVYILLGVHEGLAGEGYSWGVSISFGLCVGICQGALFRGRPLPPPPGLTRSKQAGKQ
jgi:hypothetical protein